MTLAELLEGRFRADVRFRGAAYLKAERVAITRVTADELFAVVRDGVEYQTQLSRQDGRLKMFCNCVASAQTEPSCKHLWGTVLAVDEGNYLSGEIKAGHVPPFFTEPRPALILDDDLSGDDNDLPGDFFEPGGGGTTRSVEAPSIPSTGWQSRLLQVRQTLAQEPTAQPSAPREQEIFYEIDVDQSRSIGQIVIQTSHRQRRGNGQWGKLKPLRLRPNRIDEAVDSDDARILAYLSGGTPERTNWHAQQAEIQSAVHRFRIPHELCELIMPLMCATGRVRYLNSDERSAAPLTWDDGPPWELSLRLVPDEGEASDADAEKKRPIAFASAGVVEESPTDDNATEDPPEDSASDQAINEDGEDEGGEDEELDGSEAVEPDVIEPDAIEVEADESPVDTGKGSWRVDGQLCRENEILPLGRTVLLVPGGLVLTTKRIARFATSAPSPGSSCSNAARGCACHSAKSTTSSINCSTCPHCRTRSSRGAAAGRSHLRSCAAYHAAAAPRRFLHGDRLQGDVSFDYVGTQVRASSSQWAIVQRAWPLHRAEQGTRGAAWLQLVEQGFRRLLDPRRTGRDIEISARSLGPAVRAIAAEGWQVHADGKRVRQPTDLKFRVRSNVDWFELHATVDFEGRTIRLPDLLSAVARGDTTVRLDDGSLGILPEEWIERFSLLATLGTAEEDHVRYAMNTVTMLDALLATVPETDYDTQFLELRSRLGLAATGAGRRRAARVPRRAAGYQKEGLGWLKFLQDLRFGGCLADDMGLGKTVQFLAVVSKGKPATRAWCPRSSWSPVADVQLAQRVHPLRAESQNHRVQRHRPRGPTPGPRQARHRAHHLRHPPARRARPQGRQLRLLILDEAQTIKNAGIRPPRPCGFCGPPSAGPERHADREQPGRFVEALRVPEPGHAGAASSSKLAAGARSDEQPRAASRRDLRPFILRRTKKQVARTCPRKPSRRSTANSEPEQRRSTTSCATIPASLLKRSTATASASQDARARGPARACGRPPATRGLIDKQRRGTVAPSSTCSSRTCRKRCRRAKDAGLLAVHQLAGHRPRHARSRRHPLRIPRRPDPQPPREVSASRTIPTAALPDQSQGRRRRPEPHGGRIRLPARPVVEPGCRGPGDRPRAPHRPNEAGLRLSHHRPNTVEEKVLELQKTKRELADAILQADANLLKDLTVEDLEKLLS